MTLQMFVLPPEPDLLPGDRDVIAWVQAQGVDPNQVLRDGQHWTELDDGTFAWHYLEFVLDEQGHRILVPAESDDYRYGARSTHVKRPRLRRVRTRPPCTIRAATAA